MFAFAKPALATPADRLIAAARWRWYETAFWLGTLLVLFAFPGYLQLASQIAIVGLFALSLDLLMGYAGIISLGHAAFFGFGAYVAGIIAKYGWGEPLSGMVIAGLSAGLLGLIVSPIITRLHGIALLMVTMGLCVLLFEAANRAVWLTGGDDGLQGVEIWPIFGTFTFDLLGRTAYLYALIVLFLMFLVARRIVHSPFGLSLQAMRDNPRRAPAIGTDMGERVRIVYTISAAMAGVAGALIAQTTQFVALEVLSFQRSAEIMIILILGGTGRLFGGLIGAAVFMIARDQLATSYPQYWYLGIGALLVAVVMFARGGVMGGFDRLVRWWRARAGAGR
ncbi:MAG: branched-chain amino acid ABC transporter permease [Rhodospirillales bacterium]|nr:branched-chain amino acid ABC transporter permease [Rhodospirillales bacterium]